MTFGRRAIDEADADTVQLIARTARKTVGETVIAQTEEILRLVDKDLEAAGADRSDIKLATIWLRDLSEFSQMNGIWNDWIADASLTRRLILEDPNLPLLCEIRIKMALLPK